MLKDPRKWKNPRLWRCRAWYWEFFDFFAIFKTKRNKYQNRAGKQQNRTPYIFNRLHLVLSQPLRPFSLTKRVNFCIFDSLTSNRWYRTCCISLQHPFWILLKQKWRKESKMIWQTPVLVDRVKNFSENIFGRQKNSNSIRGKLVPNRYQIHFYEMIKLRKWYIFAWTFTFSFWVTEIDKSENAPANKTVQIQIQ